MKVLAVIPARYESTRFPGKPLIDIKGKPMIQRVWEGVKACEEISEVIIATDDKKIFDRAIEFGAKVEMTQKNHQSGTDRVNEVAQRNSGYDLIINVQGDEPLVEANHLQKIIQLFKNNSVEIGTLCCPISKEVAQDHNNVKVVKSANNKALYFSRSIVPFERASGAHYFKHIGLYAFRTEILSKISNYPTGYLESIESLEQLRWMEKDHNIYLAEVEKATPSIDTPADLEKLLGQYDD